MDVLNRNPKKRPGPKKLILFGSEEEEIIDQKEPEKGSNSRIYQSLSLSFYDCVECSIHAIKFFLDYMLCCKILFYFFRSKESKVPPTTSAIQTTKVHLGNLQQLSENDDLLDSLQKQKRGDTCSNIYSNFFQLNQQQNSLTHHFNEIPEMRLASRFQQQIRIYDDHVNNLILDLDETLIHCGEHRLNSEASKISVSFGCDAVKTYFLHQRSHLQEFLEQCAEEYNIYIYTASRKEYAEEVVRQIDPQAVIKRIFSREYCFFDKKQFNKNVKTLGLSNLDRTVMIDNSQICVDANLEFSFKIKDFTDDTNDRELLKFALILKQMSSFSGPFTEFIQNYSS